MTNYSRTTLRELKKRYLNILKKCLLANLMAFSFVLPSMAETEIDVYTKEITQEQYRDGGNFKISSNTSKTYENITHFLDNKVTSTNGFVYGGNLYSNGAVTFRDEALFDGTIITGESAQGSAIYNNSGELIFEGSAIFKNNKSIATTKDAIGAIQNWSNATIIFKKSALFENNSASGVDKGQGGAIYNVGGSVVFEDTDNNTETPAVPNITYGMTFKGDTTFTGNKAESVNGSAQGGAINNTGYMNFTDEALFEGNEVESENSEVRGGGIYNSGTITFGGLATFDGNKSSATGGSSHGGAIWNYGTNAVLTFNNEAQFKNNTATANAIEKADGILVGGNHHGGAISNNGSITFDALATFEENTSLATGGNAYGGAINNYNNASITFGGLATFDGNKSSATGGHSYGGAINNSSFITFGGLATFDGNSAIATGGNSFGGAINNSGTITFSGLATFDGNTSSATGGYSYGGAIRNEGANAVLTFNNEAQFKNNTATANAIEKADGTLAGGYSYGGAIYNAGIINFNNSFTFTGNKTISKGVETPNDIYNGGTINFNHGYADDGVTPLIGSLDGGILNNGTINKTGAGTLILGDEMVSSGTGTFNQSAGLTIAHTDHFLTGTNNITGGELRVHGANMSNLNATVGGDALLTFLSTSTSEIEMKLGENVSVAGDVKFGADESIGTAKYHLKEDVRAKTITIQDSILTVENKAFNGTYVMGENVTLDMQDGDTADSVGFANLSGESSDLLFDIELKANTGEGLDLESDKLSVQTPTDETYKVKVDLAKINVIGEVGDNGLNETYTTKVLEGEAEFETATNELKVFTDVYQYDVTVDEDKQSIKLSSIGAAGENALKEAMDYEGNSAFKFSIVGKDYAFNSDTPITLGSGEKNIVGQGVDTSTIASGDKKLFVIDNENTSFKISDVALSGTGEIIENKAGSVTLEKVSIEGGKVINKDELMIEESSVHVVENAGTLTANSSTIGALMNGNKAEVTGGKVTMLTNKGELTVTGATITELLNEQEATITGGELETVTNKEKGMLSLSAGLRAGTVTNEGELTLDAVTVADLTNSATLKANGSTVQKLVNEQEAELTALTVEDLTNMGKMTAKDLTLKGALKGTGTATLSGKLVADDIFKSENKIISDGMEVSENIQKIELADLEIKSGTTLDIGTREVTAKEVKVGDKATLQVTLNDLEEHGTMKADKIEAGAGAGVHLVLGEKFEGGVFDVFQGTKGAGDLEVKHNNLYNVIEVEEGKYSFMTKDTEALQESLGATKEEVSVADAMTKGTSTNAAFNKMQSEMLIALQSLETDTVAKAKKALSAVGAKEQPIEQSVASEHLVALQNVVQAELHGSTVGHSGGEEEARAKVYIKGLYDRTKSSMGEGFRARSKGTLLGVQSEVTDTLTLGVGYATSQTTAKEDLRRTEVDTNTGFISAHYQPNAWWVSGLATFSRGEYEEEKQILSSMGKATYDVDSWGAQVMTGYDIKLENAIITPEVGMRYLSVKQEGYTDTLGTMVSGTRSDYLTALVGVKGTWDMGAIRPTVGVSVGYDVMTDEVSAVNTLANGASYTVTGEALDRLSATVTTGLEAKVTDRTSLKLEYSGTFRKEYQDHSGILKLEMRF